MASHRRSRSANGMILELIEVPNKLPPRLGSVQIAESAYVAEGKLPKVDLSKQILVTSPPVGSKVTAR